ncbi:hypothetical protein ACPZ19_42080 [Amycolatopsis lurida]
MAGFTLVVCDRGGCLQASGGHDVLRALGAFVRSTRHGILVRAGCLFQALDDEDAPCCRGRGGAGAFVLVQRCDAARRPLGSAVVAGPLHEAADTAALCDWLASGFDAGEPLPSHLRPVTVSGNS